MLTETYVGQNTLRSYKIALDYAAESRTELELRRGKVFRYDRDIFFLFMFKANCQISHLYMYTMRNEEALFYIKEALAAARSQKPDETGEISNLLDALKSMAQICGILKTGEGAKYAEEAYNLMSGQHGPEHMELLISVTSVIDCCEDARNFADAERFFLSDLFFRAKKMKFQQNQE
jgi:hypothetical protein